MPAACVCKHLECPVLTSRLALLPSDHINCDGGLQENLCSIAGWLWYNREQAGVVRSALPLALTCHDTLYLSLVSLLLGYLRTHSYDNCVWN